MNDHFEEINIHSIESAAVYGIDLLSFDLVVDDGLIKKALISNSFLNRKIQELSFPQSLKLYTLAFEKIDYDYSQYYSHAFVSTLEDLLSQSVSERTKQIRRLILEQSTIYGLLTFFFKLSSILEISALANYSIRERDRVSDLFEMYCGSRLGFGAINLFNYTNDVSDGYIFKIEKTLAFLKEYTEELSVLLLQHPLLLKRARGLAVVQESHFDSENYVKSDFSLLSTDVYQRILNKYDLFIKSLNTISELLTKISKSSLTDDDTLRFQKNDPLPWSFQSIKTPRGEAGFYLEFDQSTKTIRSVEVSTYSSRIISLVEKILVGNNLDDLSLIVGSFDLSSSEIDL